MLSVINVDESNTWDTIVRSFQKYDVQYLNGYAKAFEHHGEGTPILIYYEDDSTRAMNVVMKRDISEAKQFKRILPKNEWFDLSTPPGYGGFWIEGENQEAVEKAYVRFCEEKGFVSEFVRFHLFSNYRNCFSGETEARQKNVIRSLDEDIDDIVMDFEYKVRKNLKKASRSGLRSEIDSSGKRLNEFLSIYYGTMRRNNVDTDSVFSEVFFKTINKLADNYVYLHVYFKELIISSELILYGPDNCYSFLGGTDEKYFDLRPNDFLKFEAIKWAKKKGLKRFVLGGGHGRDDGIFRFKKSFAPNGIHDYYIGRRVINQSKYDDLLLLRSGDKSFVQDKGFFPEYRRDVE
ncbi:MAG TPA: GNAT family N-acetyltransferase [Kosmotogaceae bacterium]|nr:GNAT family N-acetyltransferase [Kosmotogaceae bacterium]